MKNAYLVRTLLTVLLLWQITGPLISQSKREVIAYRKTHLDELLSDPRKPITPEEKDLIKYFSFKKSWQVEAEFVPLEKEPVFQMPTYSGITRDYRKFATATMTHGQKKITVFLYPSIKITFSYPLKITPTVRKVMEVAVIWM